MPPRGHSIPCMKRLSGRSPRASTVGLAGSCRASMDSTGLLAVTSRPGSTSVRSCDPRTPSSAAAVPSPNHRLVSSLGAAGSVRSVMVPSDPYTKVQSSTQVLVWSAAPRSTDRMVGVVRSVTSTM